MPLPSFRSSRSKVRRRRSHHALKAQTTATCPKCEAILLPHRACKKCGHYNGRSVLVAGMEEVKKAIKKTVKKVTKTKKTEDHDHAGHDHTGHDHA